MSIWLQSPHIIFNILNQGYDVGNLTTRLEKNTTKNETK